MIDTKPLRMIYDAVEHQISSPDTEVCSISAKDWGMLTIPGLIVTLTVVARRDTHTAALKKVEAARTLMQRLPFEIPGYRVMEIDAIEMGVDKVRYDSTYRAWVLFKIKLQGGKYHA